MNALSLRTKIGKLNQNLLDMHINNKVINCFFVLIIISIQIGKTQGDNIKTLEIDFKTGEITPNPNTIELKEGDLYRIKVKNINTYLYKISVNTKDTILENAIDFPSISALGIESVSGLLSGIKGIGLPFPLPLKINVSEEIDSALNEINPSIATETNDPSNIMSDDSWIEDLEDLFNRTMRPARRAEDRIAQEKDLLNQKQLNLEEEEKEVNAWLDIAKNFVYDTQYQSFDIVSFIQNRPDPSQLILLKNFLNTSFNKYENDMETYCKQIGKSPLKERHEAVLNAYQLLIKGLEAMISALSDKNTDFMLGLVVSRRMLFETNLLQNEEADEKLEVINETFQTLTHYFDSLVARYLFVEMIDENLNISGKSLQKKIDDYRELILRDVTELRLKIQQLRRDYQNEIYQFKIRDVFIGNEALIKQDQTIETVYDSIISRLNKAVSLVNSSRYKSLMNTAAHIANNKDYCYTSLPIQLNGDQTSLSLQVTPRNEDSFLQKYQIIDVRFPKRPKFSIGIGSSLYISGLNDEAFSTITDISTMSMTNDSGQVTIIQDTSFTPIQEENTSKFEIGSLVSLHGNWLLKNNWSAGFALGLGISYTKSVRPRFHFGPYLSYGKRNAITLGLGIIGGYVDRKSSVLEEREKFRSDPGNVVVSRLEGSCYFSLGYLRRF